MVVNTAKSNDKERYDPNPYANGLPGLYSPYTYLVCPCQILYNNARPSTGTSILFLLA
jgi:hypothetical protein